MPAFSFISFAIASGLSVIAAIALTSWMARRLPSLIRSLHWLGFMMILGAGAQSAWLLAQDSSAGAWPSLALAVLALATGLAIYLESARQHNIRRHGGAAQDQSS